MAPPVMMAASQLEQLASMTVLSVDTGDLTILAELAETGLITDATTNPLFVSQAGLSGDPTYVAFVDEAIEYAKEKAGSEGTDAVVSLAMDRLAVNLGLSINKLIKGYVSTEVDPRLSFDTPESLRRARRIIAMYEDAGVPRDRVLIKLAATWEGIMAARELEKEGITCNLTLVFGLIQCIAAAQNGARLISPFPGRILDYHKRVDRFDTCAPEDDNGVVEVKKMYGYCRKYGYPMIVMPASWRPSRGAGYETDEIVALAGVDRMTIPPNFLKMLADSTDPLPRVLEAEAAAAEYEGPEIDGGSIKETTFRLAMNQDGCTTEKLAEGLRAFIADTEKLEAAIRSKL